jgi:hypothetical protein
VQGVDGERLDDAHSRPVFCVVSRSGNSLSYPSPPADSSVFGSASAASNVDRSAFLGPTRVARRIGPVGGRDDTFDAWPISSLSGLTLDPWRVRVSSMPVGARCA